MYIVISLMFVLLILSDNNTELDLDIKEELKIIK
jgi:hypothetical protein